MSRAEFYQSHLNLVSRSFAFCIARLPEPLREQVGLAYLLCRVLDCVEDANWEEKDGQRQAQLSQFNQFINFMTEAAEPQVIKVWVQKFPNGLPEAEQELLQISGELLGDFHAHPPEVQAALLNPILSMARGMSYFAQRKNDRGELKIRSLRELNQYCFFVAGVVGEILTSLVKLQNVNIRDSELENAIHFGFFLQKINILKDQLEDEGEGRFFVPSRDLVKQSLEQHAKCALEYVTQLPERLKGFRLFCSWSLFIGLASVPWIEKSWRAKKLMKIPRLQTQSLLWEIESKVENNSELTELFGELFPGAMKSADIAVGVVVNEPADDLMNLYSGNLSHMQLKKLGVAG